MLLTPDQVNPTGCQVVAGLAGGTPCRVGMDLAIKGKNSYSFPWSFLGDSSEAGFPISITRTE